KTEMDGPKRPRVLLVPFPLQGHITPMLQLGTILHAKGISVTVLHPDFNSPNASNHPEFTFLPLSENLSGNKATLANAFQFISAMNVNCREPFQVYMDQMMKQQELEGSVACVIYDSVMHFAESVATQFDLPSLVLRTTSAANLLAYHVILRLHEQNLIPLPESKLDDAVPELGFLRYKDLPYSISSKIPEPILEFLPSSFNIRSSKAVIWNTVDTLEKSPLTGLQQLYQVPFFTIGPIHKTTPPHNPTSLIKEDTNCITWLDKHAPNSVIYVSLGSLATIDAQELIETAIGLVDSEQPFLWVVRPNSVKGSEWMESLPDELAHSIET
ncbi:hypothetical protein RD792_009443, partial [Penstemon davidsonii]